jgi:hypothetical protein
LLNKVIDSSKDVPQISHQFGDLAAILPPIWNPDAHLSDLEHLSGENTPNIGTDRLTPVSVKKLSLDPPCLHFEELTLLQSSSERIRAYIRKMQELITYDTGLQDWMAYEKERSKPQKD